MAFSYQTLLQLALLVALGGLLGSRGRGRPVTRAYLAALGCVAALALVPHSELIRRHVDGPHHVHPTEFYHYYLGTKYFAELGYTGLYRASAVAEQELDPEGFRPDETLRHLPRPEFEVRKGDVLRSREAIVGRFEPARWQEFKRDLRFLQRFDLRTWGNSRPELDHGYNGTPVTTLVLGGLARGSGLPASRFVPWAAWLDFLLIAGVTLALTRLAGAEVALAFAALWALNPLNDYAFTGGAFLRHLHLAALTLGIAWLARNRPVLGAAGFTLAAGLRVFPALFPAAVLAHDLVNRKPWQRLRRHRRFYGGLLVAAVLLGALSLTIRTPEGSNAWGPFAARIQSHHANVSPNRVGLPFALSVSSEHRLADIAAPDSGRRLDEWPQGLRRTFSERRVVYGLMLAACGLLSLAYLRSVAVAQAPFLGLLWLFLLAMPSHYDWVVLAVVPVLFPDDRRTWLLLAGLGVALLLLEAGVPLQRSPDLLHAWISIALGIFLAAVTFLHTDWRRALAPPREEPPPAA